MPTMPPIRASRPSTGVADEGNRRSFFQTISRFAHSPAALDHGRWRRFAAFMADAGLIDAPKPVEDYAQDWR